MAVAAVLDLDELSEQAATLDRRAEQLRAEARELSQQAIDLRLEVERAGREPVRVTNFRKGIGVERDARFLARLGDLLGQIGPCKSTMLAEHLNAPQTRVLAGLTTLERSGVVKRSGIRRGTIWGLTEDEDLNGHSADASAYTLVLNAGQKLDTFDVETIDAELPMLTTGAIRRALRELTDEGTFSVVKDGNRNIYAFERPEGKTVNRPKQPPPEQKVIEFARKSPLRSRGAPVRGSGRSKRSASSIVNELLRELKDWPIVEVSRHSHSYRFKIDGETISSCSLTPGASALGETRRRLRQAGIEVRER